MSPNEHIRLGHCFGYFFTKLGDFVQSFGHTVRSYCAMGPLTVFSRSNQSWKLVVIGLCRFPGFDLLFTNKNVFLSWFDQKVKNSDFYGAATLRITTFSRTTPSIMTLSIIKHCKLKNWHSPWYWAIINVTFTTTLSRMTLSITIKCKQKNWYWPWYSVKINV